uniref:Uncharacterized protein n=1 Tax=Arundo donax TaxID=35708 RepID=A0A0A9GPA0_ARUDO
MASPKLPHELSVRFSVAPIKQVDGHEAYHLVGAKQK